MAYRVIGFAARMCLELGLHRREALMKSFPNEDQWADVTKIFWTIYSLDRRWSLGTGLPFVIQDEDVDPNLPEPVSQKPGTTRVILRLTNGSRTHRCLT
jgi:hypothetical protein